MEAQDAVNKALTEATRKAALDAQENLSAAKTEFASKIGQLHTTVTDLAKKHSGEIQQLTGVVSENAIADKAGRDQLKKISDFNKGQINNAIRDAIKSGENRALAIESKMKGVNQKTRSELNNKITTEISHLRKAIHGQITELTLETKEARAEMKKEILFAVKSAETLAKKNLKDMVEWSEKKFQDLHSNLDQFANDSAEARAALKKDQDKKKADILAHLQDAVAAQEAAMLAHRNVVCDEVGILSGVINDMGEHVETEEALKKNHCGGGKINNKLTAAFELMKSNAKEVGAKMKQNNDALIGSLEEARKQADDGLNDANEAMVKRYDETIDMVKDGIEEAAKKSKERFGDLYEAMADQQIEVANQLKGAVSELNDHIAEAAALEDERFSKTVKDLAAAKAKAREDVEAAKKAMASSMLKTNEYLDNVETRLMGEINVLSGNIGDEERAQAAIKIKVDRQLKQLVEDSNDFETKNKNARGVIRNLMDQYKKIAHEEVTNLARESEEAVKGIQDKQKEYMELFSKDLTKATERLEGELIAWAKTQSAFISTHNDLLAAKQSAVADSLQRAKDTFESRLTTLTNAVTANAKHFQEVFEEKTGVVLDWKENSSADREAIRDVRDAMVADLQKQIVAAIQKGEARMTGVQEDAMANVDAEKKAMLTTIATSVENMANNVFLVLQEKRQKIADNYLSLKAYAQAAADGIEDYLKKGKGRNLSSIGDLLFSLSQMGTKTPPAMGEGFGAEELPLVFSGEKVKVDSSVSKINGLVNEYIDQMSGVKDRWPMGLGYYLIARLEIAMQGPGALEVDKIEGRAGNFVFINAHSVGLSSKLPDFEGLAMRMDAYEASLASLTQTLPKEKTTAKKTHYVHGPEWQGD